MKNLKKIVTVPKDYEKKIFLNSLSFNDVFGYLLLFLDKQNESVTSIFTKNMLFQLINNNSEIKINPLDIFSIENDHLFINVDIKRTKNEFIKKYKNINLEESGFKLLDADLKRLFKLSLYEITSRSFHDLNLLQLKKLIDNY